MVELTPQPESGEDIASEWHKVTSIDEMQAFYVSRLPAIREAARKCGYAIGLHGSTRRDLDLIAVPWVDGHSDPDDLARAIHKSACGFTSESYVWHRKPHGRTAASMPICWPTWYDMTGAGHIDLSVVGLSEQAIPFEDENARLKVIAAHLHWMARRYADGRQSYATSLHNENTRPLLAIGVELNAAGDGTLWARDLGGRAYDGLTDEEAAQGREADWKHDDKERRIEQQEKHIRFLITALKAIAEGDASEVRAFQTIASSIIRKDHQR